MLLSGEAGWRRSQPCKWLRDNLLGKERGMCGNSEAVGTGAWAPCGGGMRKSWRDSVAMVGRLG